MPKTECITEKTLYQVLYHELLSKAAPGRPTRQAPRLPVATLRSIERLVVNEGELPYIRLHSWWTLLLAVRRPQGYRVRIRVSQLGLQARLTRSKTTGSDKTVLCRPVVVDSICVRVRATLARSRMENHEADRRLRARLPDASTQPELQRSTADGAPIRRRIRDSESRPFSDDAHSTTAHGILDPTFRQNLHAELLRNTAVH